MFKNKRQDRALKANANQASGYFPGIADFNRQAKDELDGKSGSPSARFPARRRQLASHGSCVAAN
jgi:hypothetical protein